MRPQFWIVLTVSAIVFALHFAAVQFLSDLRWQEAAMASLVLTVVTYVTAMGSLAAQRGVHARVYLEVPEHARPAQIEIAVTKADDLVE